jgi:hypothetical protein
LKIRHIFDGKISFILTLFPVDFLYSIALAQDITDNKYFPHIWYILRCGKKNRVVALIIEVKDLDEVREESHLDVAEVDKKRHWALRLL